MPRSVPITLDKERNLLLDFNALADASEAGGESVSRFITGGIDPHGMRALLWAGLRHEDPKLTPHAVGELIQAKLDEGEGVASFSAKLWAALVAMGLAGNKKAEPKNDNPGTRLDS